jgi:hypothetical protein
MRSRSWSMSLGSWLVMIASVGLLASAHAAEPVAPASAAAPASAGAPATEDARIDALMARLQAMPGVYARFTEEKTIGLLAKPLVNHGTLHYMPPGRLLRTIDEPFRSQVLLVEGSIWLREGGASERIDLGAHPAARSFVGSFRSLLAGDREALAQHFELGLQTGHDDTWVLELRPRTKDMARIVTKMRVSGRGELVDRLVIEEASGDVSDTRFFDVDPRRQYSAEAAAQLFQPPV